MITDGDRDNIYKYMLGFFNLPSLTCRWEPRFIDVSEDFSLGYTSGTYVREYKEDGILIIEKGKYTTIWKKLS